MSTINNISIGQEVFIGYYQDSKPVSAVVRSNNGYVVEVSKENKYGETRVYEFVQPTIDNGCLMEINNQDMRLFLSIEDFNKFRGVLLDYEMVMHRLNKLNNPDDIYRCRDIVKNIENETRYLFATKAN